MATPLPSQRARLEGTVGMRPNRGCTSLPGLHRAGALYIDGMRPHPIPPVSEPLQYRAIGVVRGTYVPADADQITRGHIHTADGEQIEAVVLGRLLTLMRRHLDLGQPHLWVAYPRSREQGGLHLQLVGIWEPSTLATGEPEPEALTEAGEPQPDPEQCRDSLPEGDEYFSLRGELIYTKPETGDLVIKVRQLPRADGQRPAPFKLQLRGEIPLEHLRHFVSIDGRRHGQQLQVETFEVMAPVVQRGNRGGKGRRDSRGGAGGGGGRSGGRPPQAPGPSSDRSTDRSADLSADRTGSSLRSAVTRPSR
jgi:hypothetical protein